MWEVFFLSGIVFLLLGIFEFKRYRKEKFKEYTDTSKAIKSILQQNEKSTSPQQNIIKKKVIPLDLPLDTIKSEHPENKELEQFSQDNLATITQPSYDIEEKKRLWENHWIVKKVKERFEKKQEIEEPQENSLPNLLPSQEHSKAEESIKEQDVEKKPEDDEKKKEKEEKEFNPFDIFG